MQDKPVCVPTDFLFWLYVYDAFARPEQDFRPSVLLRIYADTVLSLTTVVAFFTSVVDNQIIDLGPGQPWITQVIRSFAFTVDVLTGFGFFSTNPYGNWALVLCIVMTIHAFCVNFSLLGDAFGRFFEELRSWRQAKFSLKRVPSTENLHEQDE